MMNQSQIHREIASFEKEISWIKSLSASLQKSIGTKKEMDFLESNTSELQNDYRDMITKMKPLEAHALDMKISGRDRIVVMSEAISKNPWEDVNHIKKLQNKPLDADQAKKMRDIQQNYQLLDLQLEDLQQVQHAAWMTYFQLPDELRKCIPAVSSDVTKQYELSKAPQCTDDKCNSIALSNGSVFNTCKTVAIKLDSTVENLHFIAPKKKTEMVVIPHDQSNMKCSKTQDHVQISSLSANDSKISQLWKRRTDYEGLLQSLTPFEIIKELRESINKMADECIAMKESQLKSIFQSKKSGSKSNDTLDNHIQIILSQIETFQKFVAVLKSRLTVIYKDPVATLVNKCEKILEELRIECMILETFSPFYAFKEQFLSLNDSHSVTVIVADPLYSCNVVIPMFLQNQSSSIVAGVCDPDVTISRITHKRITSLFGETIADFGLDKIHVNHGQILCTDIEEMYSFSISNPQFSPFSHIVLHCPLSRSAELDFLICALKKCLSHREDFKVVIILMPTDDKTKFLQYFSNATTVGLIQPSDLNFPVSTVWKGSSSSSDHIQEIVETALSIHVLNPPGDVLIFLTSNEDIISVREGLFAAMRKYNICDFQCISVYEAFNRGTNMQSNEVRNFYLAHNHAELLLLATVSYVIDPGLTISCTYNHKKCLEVKKLTFVSRSRCKLRNSCSGRYRPGLCYCLYSKSSYREVMTEYESSDISAKNPFDIMLKMFQFSPENVENIDYVDPFSDASRKKALSALESANAVKHGKLTALGKNMIKLPFLPRYSKLIVLGVQWGFAFEAVVLVAILLVKRPIFLYTDNSQDLKFDIDLKKQELLLCDSESLTCLNVYHLWMQNDYQESWCAENCLDYDVLRKIRKRVTQIVRITKEQLKETVSVDILTNQRKDYTVLQEIVFECFTDNLSVYSGHNKSGYCLHNSQSMAFLHPHSPLQQNNTLPQFVVFSNLHSTTRNIMQFVTAIPGELILQAINKGTIPASMIDLFEVKLDRYVIENIGITVVNCLLHGKKGADLFTFEEQLKERLQNDQIILEASAERGSIILYAPSKDLPEAQIVMQEMLNEKKENLICEKEQQYIEIKKGMNSIFINVTWGKGAVIIEASHNPSQVLSLDGKEAQKNVECHTVKQSVILTWPRRLCRGYGFVSFHDDSDFSIARRLSMKLHEFNSKSIEIKLHDAYKKQLVVSGLPPETTLEDFELIVRSILPDNVNVKEVNIAFEKPFATTKHDMEHYKQQLQDACAVFTTTNEVEISVETPDTDASVMSSTIEFTCKIPEHQLNHFFNNSFTMDNLPVKAQICYTSTLFTSVEIFNAVQETLISELKGFEEHLIQKVSSLFQFEANSINFDTVTLQLSAKDDQVMNMLLEVLHKALEGLVMRSNDIEGLQKLFTHGGHLWLRATEKKENVYIIDEYKSKAIHIFGSTVACKKTVRRITEFLGNLKDEVVVIVDLSQGRNDRKLMKAVIQKYGCHLKPLIEKFNLRFAEIKINTGELVLHGSAEAIQQAESDIEKISRKHLWQSDEEKSSFREVCAVCQMPVLQLSIRLEQCTHLYCFECLVFLLLNSPFPIVCCYEGCNEELALEDIRKGLDYDEELITNLMNRSLSDYVSKNVRQFAYCATPDCSMFYDVTQTEGEKWHCPLCRNDICVECKVIFHHGYSCEFYQGSKLDVNYSYKMWMEEKNANSKLCPSCGTGIEKTGGCNHLHCNSCKANFCWGCHQIFPDETSVNNHVPYCNGAT